MTSVIAILIGAVFFVGVVAFAGDFGEDKERLDLIYKPIFKLCSINSLFFILPKIQVLEGVWIVVIACWSVFVSQRVYIIIRRIII